MNRSPDDHLRRVEAGQTRGAAGRLQSARAHVPLLALGERRGRERITPAEIVPVVDMKRERKNLVGPEPEVRQVPDELVRRRTGAAPLRSEELDQYHAVPGGRRAPGGAVAARNQIGRASCR